MVRDSDLRSSPVVGIVIGDTRMIKRRRPHLPLLSCTPNIFINEHDFRKLKKLFNECRQMQLIPFLLNKRKIGEHVLAYFMLTQGYTRLLGSKKVRFCYQFYFFHHIFVYNQKTIKFTKLPNASLES
jgi:hypothetical protein